MRAIYYNRPAGGRRQKPYAGGAGATQRTPVGDAAYTIKPWDRVVSLSVTLTGSRTWTLPLARSVQPGHTIALIDEVGSVDSSTRITLQRAGSDTINEGATSYLIEEPAFYTCATSNGVDHWALDKSAFGRFNGDLRVDGNTEFGGAFNYFSGDIEIDGNVSVSLGDFSVAFGATTLGGSLGVDGDSTFNGNILAATLRDSTTTFYDNLDDTKKLAFEVSGIATATTRTATWPDASGTVVLEGATQTLTNKTVTDNSFTFQDNADTTKKFLFQASPVPTGTTLTFAVPDSSTTLVGTNATQTLSNKTLSLASSSLTGTTAQFNAALSDGDFATLAGTETLTNKTVSGPSILQNGATTPIGYTTGAGAIQTQGTSVNTGVTINAPCGRITMFGTIAAGATAVFTVTNSAVSNDDVIAISLSNNPGDVQIVTVNVTNGTFVIRIKNNDGGAATSVAPIINFAIIRVAVT